MPNSPQGTPRAVNLEAYVYRDLDGSIQRGCVMRSGSSMSNLMFRFLGRDTSRPLERTSVNEVISGGSQTK